MKAGGAKIRGKLELAPIIITIKVYKKACMFYLMD
jgi:hypothetical protein